MFVRRKIDSSSHLFTKRARLQLIDGSTTKPASLHYKCSCVCVNHIRHRGGFVAAQLKV